jgi:hypothetical protein
MDRPCGLVARVPWLQIQWSGFCSQRFQIFWEVVGLERGPLSLVSTISNLLERKSNGSDLEEREYGCRDQSRWPSGTLYTQKLVLTSPASGGRSVGIVRFRTQATDIFPNKWIPGIVLGWVKRGWRVRPNRDLWADCLENVETLAPHTILALHGLFTGIALLSYFFTYLV